MDIRQSESVANEKAVVVGVMLPDAEHLEAEPLDEIKGLAEAAGAEVVGEIFQRRDAPDQATYLGKGKVEELRVLAESRGADVILFDADLSPSQTRNLEKATACKVLDRTEVILDIFATRARTHEARLAVELAQLQYSLPRLKRMWTHLSRLKMGIGMRGPGEKQLEVDRRLVEKRIHLLSEELKTVHARREREVAARYDRMTVSLVGYTNAGKSTLLNRLTESDVTAEDMLFATLDTRTRRWRLPGWGPVLLSDTVGFIRRLPHHLVASFKATLEEARQADLLLHIADASSPAALDQISAVFTVLEELGIEQKDTLLVLNKVDAVRQTGQLERLLARYPYALCVSARTGRGLDALTAAVSDALSRGFLDLEIEADVGDGKLLALLAAHGEIVSQQFDEKLAHIHCRVPSALLGRIRASGAAVRTRKPAAAGVADLAPDAVDRPMGEVA